MDDEIVVEPGDQIVVSDPDADVDNHVEVKDFSTEIDESVNVNVVVVPPEPDATEPVEETHDPATCVHCTAIDALREELTTVEEIVEEPIATPSAELSEEEQPAEVVPVEEDQGPSESKETESTDKPKRSRRFGR